MKMKCYTCDSPKMTFEGTVTKDNGTFRKFRCPTCFSEFEVQSELVDSRSDFDVFENKPTTDKDLSEEKDDDARQDEDPGS